MAQHNSKAYFHHPYVGSSDLHTGELKMRN